MDILPGYGRSGRGRDPHQDSIWYPRPGCIMTNSIQGHSNRHVGNVSSSFNTTINLGVNEKLRIEAWLSPLEPCGRHEYVRNHRVDGIGDWFLKRNEFESWVGSRGGSVNATLLCYGGPGVGKTYISSLVIDALGKQARGQNIAVLSLYCDYKERENQSAVNMIGCLLEQVTWSAARIPSEIQSAFEDSKKGGGQGLRLPDMLGLFVKVISSIECVYICVDALDELLPQDRSGFLRSLRQIIQDAPNTRLFLTGRPHIRGELEKHLMKGAHIDIVADQDDIARYLSQKMDEDDDRGQELMKKSLKHDITKAIMKKASGTFLLVALNIYAILGQTTIAKRKRMLREVVRTGVSLDSVYGETIQRIREQEGGQSRLGMEVLAWVSHSVRPLRISELRHALAIEVASTDLDRENIPPLDTVLGSCLGLVVVDEETSTVRLIHYTLQEHLFADHILPNAHQTLAEACLAYLHYEWVKGLPFDVDPNLSDMPFLEYSSSYWGIHAKEGLSGGVKSLALELSNLYDTHISSTLLFNRINCFGSSSATPYLFTGLHCASYFGIIEVVTSLIEMKNCHINQRDCIGHTPLMWAARQGNEEVVGLLLTRGDVVPDEPDNDGRTALSWASSLGYEGVVRLLLTRGDVNPDEPDNDGRTALSWASSLGYEKVVRLLLARGDVNPDKADNYGQTALWWASQGSKDVGRLLLTSGDFNLDRSHNHGQNVLNWASALVYEGIVRTLFTWENANPGESQRLSSHGPVGFSGG